MRLLFFVLLIAFAVILLFLYFLLGYYSINLEAAGAVQRLLTFAGPDGLESKIDIAEYFPMELGLRWEYKITTGQGAPFSYSYIRDGLFSGNAIPLNKAVERSRDIVLPDGENDEYLLTLGVANTLRQDGPAANVGAEVSISRDDLGIFKDVQQLFWILDDSGYSPVMIQVAIHPLYNLRDGVSLGKSVEYRTLLGEAFPGEPILYFSETDRLTFIGAEEGLLHFLRVVQPKNEGVPFVEHSFFQKNKGLVELWQESSDGETIMTWRLTGFTGAPAPQ